MALDTTAPVLVVDDNPIMLDIVCALLGELGFRRVDRTGSADEALEALRAVPYRLLITDWNMGAVSGLDLIREVRAGGGEEGPRILVMTASSQAARKVEARAAGANDYLVKPFTPAVLQRKIAALLAA